MRWSVRNRAPGCRRFASCFSAMWRGSGFGANAQENLHCSARARSDWSWCFATGPVVDGFRGCCTWARCRSAGVGFVVDYMVDEHPRDWCGEELFVGVVDSAGDTEVG